MQIKYLFSRNKQIGSKLIAYGSKKTDSYYRITEIPSHAAVLVDNKFVIESTMLSGVRVVPYDSWKTINEELYSIPHKKDMSWDELKETLLDMWGKKYDTIGLIYFTFKVILNVLFKKPMPEHNPWERENYFFCTELVGRLNNKNYSMTTPAKLCDNLLMEIY